MLLVPGIDITEESWKIVQGNLKTSLIGCFPCVWISVRSKGSVLYARPSCLVATWSNFHQRHIYKLSLRPFDLPPSVFSRRDCDETQIDLRLPQPHGKCLRNGFFTSAVKADEDSAAAAWTSPSRAPRAPLLTPAASAASVGTLINSARL